MINNQLQFFTEPDSPHDQLCGAVGKDGLWQSFECTQEKEFACKLKSCKF